MDNGYINENNVIDDDDDTIMELDLNQEPVEPSTEPVGGLGILLDELETAHDQIEERIRRLEAVTARARQRQRWRLAHNTIPEINNRYVNQNTTATTTVQEDEEARSSRVVIDRARLGKRDSSHLVAKALEVDTRESDGRFFDCNICLDMATEPILTCCGHLFCWACFYQLPCVYSTAKECPVCKGEVTEKNITPVYGNGKSPSPVVDYDLGLKVPPRPQAHRVESLRQRRVTHRATSHVPVAEALRRIRMGISGGGDDVAVVGNATSELGGGRWRIRTHQFSSVLPDSASSLYSISSALDNAERLVDDLESFVNGRFPSGNSRTVDVNASSSQTPREDVAPMQVAETRPSSSSRRRFRLSTVAADPENGVSRELRRRRTG